MGIDSGGQNAAGPEMVVHDWQEAIHQLGDLKAGDIIAGFDFDDLLQLDTFMTHLGRWIGRKTDQSEIPIDFDPIKDSFIGLRGKHYRYWVDGSRPPSEGIKPRKRFIGKYANIAALIAEDSDSVERGPGASITSVIQADMVSTGRGTVGKTVKMMRLLSRKSTNYSVGLLSATYKNMPADNADKAAAWLRAEAESNALEIVQRNLGHIILAGLPELGKRR